MRRFSILVLLVLLLLLGYPAGAQQPAAGNTDYINIVATVDATEAQ
jgi:hypothetical protein